jgi:hypothetical protein
MPSFLSQLRESGVVIYGVTYPLDDFPSTYIDALRGRLGDNVSAIIAEIEELGHSPDTAPDVLGAGA